MRHILPILVLGLFGAILVGSVQPAEVAASVHGQAVCAGNLLVNPDFEGGSRKTEAEGTSLSSAVSDGWVPWFVRGGETLNREPEFKVEQTAIGGDPYRVRSGTQSMKWFNTWATHDAGIYQRVAVPSGATVTFSAHGMAYTGEADGWNPDLKTFLSDPEKPGNYALMVGIEPTGAVPAGMGAPPPPSVVWSPPSLAMDQFVKLEVAARAQGGAVTVFMRGNPQWAVKHNDSFWEDACLTVGGYVAPAPAPAQSAEEPAESEEAEEPAADEAAPAEEPEEPVEEVVLDRGPTRLYLPDHKPHLKYVDPVPF